VSTAELATHTSIAMLSAVAVVMGTLSI